MASSYAAGNTVRLLASFTSAGTPYDPGTVTCQVIGPSSRAVLTPTVVLDSTGNYHADVVATNTGVWSYRWSATSPASAAEGTFSVRQSRFVS